MSEPAPRFAFDREVWRKLPQPEATLVSYAQHFEDYRLWRALAHVGEGRYVDVGACDPTEFSVTRLFYDRGWRGVNIEPGDGFASFSVERPCDRNVDVAIGLVSGSLLLRTPVHGQGLATTKEFASTIESSFLSEIATKEVSVRPLRDVLVDDFPEGIDLHFLKVDVEGSEYDVLASNDWERVRPWIVVVEATLPRSHEPAPRAWVPLLESAGYRLVLFDGLNDFWVRADLAMELGPILAYPIGPQDNVVRSVDMARDAEIGRLHHAALSLRNHIDAMEAEVSTLRGSAATDAATIDAFQTQVAALQSELVNAHPAVPTLPEERSIVRTAGGVGWDYFSNLRTAVRRVLIALRTRLKS